MKASEARKISNDYHEKHFEEEMDKTLFAIKKATEKGKFVIENVSTNKLVPIELKKLGYKMTTNYIYWD